MLIGTRRALLVSTGIAYLLDQIVTSSAAAYGMRKLR